MRDIQNHLLVEHNVSTVLDEYKFWKGRWDEEMAREEPCAEVLMGLLHVAFKPFLNNNSELVCLCLEVADGCNSFRSDLKDRSLTLYDGEKGAVKYCARSEVVKKAWKVLCDNVFKNKTMTRDFGPPSWAKLVVQPEIFHKLISFFRVGESQVDDNLPLGHDQTHYDKLALKFLCEFIAFVWKSQSSRFDSSLEMKNEEAVREMFMKARPQFVEILNRINNLRFLLSEDVDVDKQTLAKLKKIALQNRLSSKGSYRSVEEAYADNSKAAEVLILLKIRQKEEERQKKIAKAERQKRQADDELNKLGAGAE